MMVTRPLPEYVWPVPSQTTIKTSSCTVYHCNGCGLFQLQDFSDHEIASFYAYGSFVEENMKGKENRLEKILNFLGPQFFKNKTVLDVGGGNNPFLKLLRGATPDLFVSDFDISPETADLCPGKIFSGNFEEVAIPEKYFDTIVSFHFMEHMNKPSRVVQKMKSLMKPDSKLIVEVPNFSEVVHKMSYYSIYHQHINMFTRSTLIGLMQGNGFQLDKVLSEDLTLLMVFRLSENLLTNEDPSSEEWVLEGLLKKMKFLEVAIADFLNSTNPQALAVYGAGGSSALLVHYFESILARIRHCYDRDSFKQGKILPGTGVCIEAPSKIGKSDAVIFLSDEILNTFKDQLTCPTLSIETLLKQAGGN